METKISGVGFTHILRLKLIRFGILFHAAVHWVVGGGEGRRTGKLWLGCNSTATNIPQNIPLFLLLLNPLMFTPMMGLRNCVSATLLWKAPESLREAGRNSACALCSYRSRINSSRRARSQDFRPNNPRPQIKRSIGKGQIQVKCQN